MGLAGRKDMPTSGSRTEFLAVDALGSANDIKYGRSGGWFVSTKKAIFIGLFFIVALVLVGILVHYFGNRPSEKLTVGTETDGNTSVVSGTTGTTEAPIPAAKLRLPGDVTPSQYQLKLDAYLEDPDPDGKKFTYRGTVSIVIHCVKSTNKVTLHSKRLQIGENVTVSIYNETVVTENTVSVPAPTVPAVLPTSMATESENNTVETKSSTVPTTAGNATLPKTPETPVTPTTSPARRPSDTPTPPVAATADNSTVIPKNSTMVPRNSTLIPNRRRRRSSGFRRHRQSRQATTAPPKTTFAPGTPPKVKERVIEEKLEMITFVVEPPLQAGKMYQLDIPFSGLLRNDSLYGFYASQYKDPNNNTKWMATTQFEAPHAREAFPCFDEPAMKAEFEISIARSSKMKTISNMPLKSTEEIKDRPGRVWDHYQVSPIMSTYLVAFIVAPSDFVASEDTMAAYLKQKGANAKGPEFKIYARQDLIESGSYAASIGPKILEFYGEYFGIPYPLPKLHMAAIPDFAAGAMENWGLLTYRETYLLYDKNSSSLYDKETVAIVVAHEIAHQWFGNLVTMKWWRDLWLNEGFANYMQYLGADHVEPDWAMLEKFLVYEQQRVMLLDSLSSTHPVSSPVDNPAQISEIFDDISYRKGASLIRMLNNSITEKVLRGGLTKYLNKWKYNNAEEDDLWAALTEETRASGDSLLPENLSLKEVMDTWTLQDGYPVVTVTRDYEKGSVQLSQTRFSLVNKTSDTLWHIPVSYATEDEMKDPTNSSRRTFPRTWIKKDKTISIPNLTKPNSESWVLFNIHATGYYRVNYDDKNWALLSAHLMNSNPSNMLPPVTRAQLLDDAMNLARAGLTGYDVALNLTQYLATEEMDLVPWKAALKNLRFLDTMLRETPAYGILLDYMIKILNPMKNVVGFEARTNETQLQTLLRPTILLGLSDAGHPEVENWAVELFQKWMNTSKPDTMNPIPVDLRDLVYCEGIKAGGRDEWHFILERFKSAGSKPSERMVLLDSLACTTEEWLLVTLLEKSLAKDGEIRRQDAFRVWRMMPVTALGSRVAFNYVRNNWGSIYDEYGKAEYLIDDFISGAISGLTTELDLKDVKEFRDMNRGKFSFAEKKLQQVIEALERRVDWHKRHYNTIVTWLQKHSQ